MKRASVIVLLVLLALMAVGPLGPAPVAAASRTAPKVVLIVGPAGSATENYKRLANQAAAAAADYTPNVVKVYSPDATWPAVKQAMTGASVVVYLGHGNGWPSRYRDQLTPSTQNGMGLNPNAGANTHQYFGEDKIGKEIKLAKDAVVIFSHLCYASGNSEPGLPEGTLDVGQQRVDNYAAGFIRAGAAAVIAEAYMGPEYYVRNILRGRSSVDRIWRDAPTYHGNLLRFDSVRSPGYTAQMDPDTASSGFHRSIVLKDGLVSSNVLAGGLRTPTGGGEAVLPPIEPSLSGLGVEFNAPNLAAPPTAGISTNLTFHLSTTDPNVLPQGMEVGVRWDPLEPTTTIAQGTSGSPPPAAPSSQAPAAPSPSASPDVDPVTLVMPETPGDVVAPVPATVSGSNVTVPVKVPSEPGLYRLVGTIHGSDGVAFDAATQALMPALIVRVTGPLTAVYDVPETAYATSGDLFQLDVGVTNLGAAAWGSPAVTHRIGGAETEPAKRATLVARWVNLAEGADVAPAPEATALLPAGLAPGSAAAVSFRIAAPTTPGDYLLFVDVITPKSGSLAVAGVPPAIVRVTVSGASAPAP
ncbi:MAG TPA: hypothetical protein VFV72_04865 [Candidatus Limnocylindrales bacterium]|nr:hypothetical protein [Candidatus Limnocylindrales bacterium]